MKQKRKERKESIGTYFWSGVEKSKRAKSGADTAVKKQIERKITNWKTVIKRIITVDIQKMKRH